VVCPDAEIKIFVTASVEARAERRHRELQGEGVEVVPESVLEDLKERDARDSERQVAPLVPAEDAIVIDTTGMRANEVFEQVISLIEAREKAA
jgi:cytidylate kinase